MVNEPVVGGTNELLEGPATAFSTFCDDWCFRLPLLVDDVVSVSALALSDLLAGAS